MQKHLTSHIHITPSSPSHFPAPLPLTPQSTSTPNAQVYSKPSDLTQSLKALHSYAYQTHPRNTEQNFQIKEKKKKNVNTEISLDAVDMNSYRQQDTQQKYQHPPNSKRFSLFTPFLPPPSPTFPSQSKMNKRNNTQGGPKQLSQDVQ